MAKNGKLPLCAAVREGKKELAYLLLDHGADIETRNVIGNTLLAESACNTDHVLVKALLERGANVEARNKKGETPLIASVCLMPGLGRRACINALLNYGADIEARRDNDDTALISAVRVGYHFNVGDLVVRGANPIARDSRGQTPLMLAISAETEEMLLPSHQRDMASYLLDAETKRFLLTSRSISKKEDLIQSYSIFNDWEHRNYFSLTEWPACIRMAAAQNVESHFLTPNNMGLAELSLTPNTATTDSYRAPPRREARKKKNPSGSKACKVQ